MARLKVNFKLKENSAISQIIQTFRQINWPSFKEIFIKTLVVLVISAIISAYLLGADYLFSLVRNQILF